MFNLGNLTPHYLTRLSSLTHSLSLQRHLSLLLLQVYEWWGIFGTSFNVCALTMLGQNVKGGQIKLQ